MAGYTYPAILKAIIVGIPTKKNIAVVGLKLLTVTFSNEILMFVTQFLSFRGKGERILRFQPSI